MDEVQTMAIRAALSKMIRDGYLNICTIDHILKMTGGIPDKRDYDILHALHCVHFREMEPELVRGIPVIVQRVINSPGIEFKFTSEYRTMLSGLKPALN